MYEPAFFEIFLGLVAVVGWCTVLARSEQAPPWVWMVPWIAGALVFAGQVVAFGTVLAGAGAGPGEPAVSGQILRWARWGSLGAVGLGLLASTLATAITVLAPANRSARGPSGRPD